MCEIAVLPGVGLRAISVFCFPPDPWDGEEVQGTVNRKWYLKYRAITLKCSVDSNSSKDLEKKFPVRSANRTLPAGSSWLPAHRTSPTDYSVGRNSTKFKKIFFFKKQGWEDLMWGTLGKQVPWKGHEGPGMNGLQGLHLDIDHGTQLKTNTAFGIWPNQQL